MGGSYNQVGRKIRLLLAVLALFLSPAIASAVTPQITVSASAVTLLGGNQTISITLTLVDSGNSGMMKIANTNIIPPGTVSSTTPGATATVGPCWGNDVIVDAYGNSNRTYYRVQVFTVSSGVVASTPVLQNFYAFTGSGTIDLSTATPLAPSFFTGPSGNVVVPGTLGVSGAFNATGGGSLAGTFSGNRTDTGNNAHSGTETFTGAINCTISNAVRCLSPSNPQGWSGATPDAWISSAITSIGSSGGELFIAAGTYNPVAQVAISTPVWIHGSGINNTTLKPTAALAAALFSSTTAVEGMKFSDMTIDMTNAPAQGAIAIPTGLRPILENVRILYPATTGTGTALSVAATGEVHARNVIIKGAGICVDVNGDASAENFWDDIVCEDPGSFGYRRLQTTSTDVGGEYLTHFKVTNPDNRTGAQAFLVSSSAANTGSPFFCAQCVGDNMKGGHTYQIHNMVNVFLDGVWATNTAVAGSNFAGVNIDTSTNVFVRGGYIASLSRDLILSGTDTTIELTNPYFGGTSTNVFAAGATLSGVRLLRPVFTAATPISAADLSLITNSVGNTIDANGWHVAVSSSQSSPQTLSICDKDTGDATPCTYLRTTTSGGLQILNNSFAQILSINQAGTVITLGASQPLTQTIGSGTSTSNGTLIGAGTSQAQPAITVTGATASDVAVCSLNAAPVATWQTGIQLLPAVVTSNTVTPWLSNPTAAGITPAATVIRCTVMR